MNEPGGIGHDKARIDALEDQVVVDTAIIKAHNREIKRLRGALDLYGVHLPNCEIRQDAEALVCTCGLVQPPAPERQDSHIIKLKRKHCGDLDCPICCNLPIPADAGRERTDHNDIHKGEKHG